MKKISFVYLKIKEGGTTVAKTSKAYIIDVYNTSKKYKYDGKELPQGVGMFNTVVEDLFSGNYIFIFTGPPKKVGRNWPGPKVAMKK